MKPYYYLHNRNVSSSLPTNPVDNDGNGTDFEDEYNVAQTFISNGSSKPQLSTSEKSNLPRTFDIGSGTNKRTQSRVEKPIATRVSNTSRVTCEIRYGKDNTLFELVEVQVDYVKSPQFIRLTQE